MLVFPNHPIAVCRCAKLIRLCRVVDSDVNIWQLHVVEIGLHHLCLFAHVPLFMLGFRTCGRYGLGTRSLPGRLG